MIANGIIPARFGSSRFPGKPLQDICGKPMIWWVYNQASKAKELSKVYVATESKKIEEVCNQFGIPCIMTSDNCRNGTERLCEASHIVDGDLYITIQGDEPLTEPENVDKLTKYMKEHPEVGCSTMKIKYENPIDVINSTTPKVVSDLNGDIMLFTRSPVPYPKSALDYSIYKPIGIYGFRKDVLQLYSTLSIGPIEKAEDIELLRYLEHGYKIRILETNSDTVAVDTPKDLERVRQIIKIKLSYEYGNAAPPPNI